MATQSGKRLMVVCLVYVTPTAPVNPKTRSVVLLVKKREPEWQRGKWNGPGGEVEPGETTLEAASRELREETGLHIEPDQWQRVATMEGRGFLVDVVKFHYPAGEFAPILSPMTEVEAAVNGTEFFGWFPTNDLPADVVPDLGWLVPLSQDGRFEPPTFTVLAERERGAEVDHFGPCIGGKETNRGESKRPAFMSKQLRETLYARDAEAERLANSNAAGTPGVIDAVATVAEAVAEPTPEPPAPAPEPEPARDPDPAPDCSCSDPGPSSSD